MHLRICGVELQPWFALKTYHQGMEYQGPVGESLVTLAKVMNFSFTLITPFDKEWGVLKNGSWSGMVGMLHRNESDLAIGPFAMTFGRSSVVDYTSLLTMNYLTILAGRTNIRPSNLFAALLTFDWQVWLGLLICFLLILFFLILTENILGNNIGRKSTFSQKFSRNFLTLFASLFCESCPATPTAAPSRLLLIFWWLAITVLMNGFSGNLKATLLLKPDFQRIDTIREVLQNPSIKVLVHKGTAYEAYIRDSQSAEFKEIWSRVLQERGVLPTEHLYTLSTLIDVQEGRSVIFSDLLTMINAVSRFCRSLNNGSFYFARQLYFPHVFSMAVRKSIRHKVLRDIRKSTRRIVEGGFFDKWLVETNHNWTLCRDMSVGNQEKRPLHMNEMKAIFVLWAIGTGLASLVFLVEKFDQYLKKRGKMRKEKLRDFNNCLEENK